MRLAGKGSIDCKEGNAMKRSPLTVILALSSAAPVCAHSVYETPEQRTADAAAAHAIDEYCDDYIHDQIPGVWSCGEGWAQDGSPVIEFFAKAITPEVKADLPTSINGIPTRIEQVSGAHHSDIYR